LTIALSPLNLALSQNELEARDPSPGLHMSWGVHEKIALGERPQAGGGKRHFLSGPLFYIAYQSRTLTYGMLKL